MAKLSCGNLLQLVYVLDHISLQPETNADCTELLRLTESAFPKSPGGWSAQQRLSSTALPQVRASERQGAQDHLECSLKHRLLGPEDYAT